MCGSMDKRAGLKATPEVGEVRREGGLAAGRSKGSFRVDRVAALCILFPQQDTLNVSNQLAPMQSAL